MPKKRRSMGKGVKKVSKNRKGGRKYLDLPEGVELFTPEGGKRYKLDILPYVVKDIKRHPDSKEIPDDIWWRYPYGLHRELGPDNELAVCPGTKGNTCIVCQEKQAIYDDPDGDNDMAAKLNPSKRGLYVIRLTSGKNSGKIMVMDISNYCFLDQLMDEIDMGEPEWKNFPDLEDGYTLKVRFKAKKIGSGKNAVEFAMADRIDFFERDDIDEDILEEVPCLEDLILVPSSKSIENTFYGIDEDDDDNEKKDPPKETAKEKKARLKKKKAAAKKKKEKEEKEKALDIDWDDLEDMDENKLLEISEAEELNFDDGDYDDEKELRNLIADALEIEKPEEKPIETKAEKKKRLKKEKAAKKKAEKDKGGSTKKALKCPFAYQFGADFEDHEECDEDDCDQYDACMEAFEKE